MSVTPTPVSLTMSVGLTTFVAWAAQVPAELDKIWVVYASFSAKDSDSISELLRELALSKYCI